MLSKIVFILYVTEFAETPAINICTCGMYTTYFIHGLTLLCSLFFFVMFISILSSLPPSPLLLMVGPMTQVSNNTPLDARLPWLCVPYNTGDMWRVQIAYSEPILHTFIHTHTHGDNLACLSFSTNTHTHTR